ncbi:hypothetical protein PZ938_01255 [Luteipulveratus sp. YIM 133132]|uniref:hypothetical protein n=1 Tax=Luteipulveratus flavus TaxID=3031728 RepID=UPI0023AEAEDD|nr:hypothetical protein [Luteipulveratus sp. YIM 133132]MDE9364222.1 hypothetical protein [Luteipulveratus sp. YIM 133132]
MIWRNLMVAMVEGLQPYRGRLPAVVADSLDVASDYWRCGRGRPEDLLGAKIECWTYLAERGSSLQVGDDEARLTRAVLCTLEPSSDAEAASDLAEWFQIMLASLE